VKTGRREDEKTRTKVVYVEKMNSSASLAVGRDVTVRL
jgi:hypothetical protein